MAMSGSSSCHHVAVGRSTTAEPQHWRWSRRRPWSVAPTTAAVALTTRPAVRCCAGRQLVDEGMPVLRRRILEMQTAAVAAAEQEDDLCCQLVEASPSAVWRGGGGGLDDQLFHVLRGFLMGSRRPGVAVGMVVLLVLSVPASAFTAVCNRLVVEWQRLLFNLIIKQHQLN